MTPDSAAAPQSGAATRAELTRWLEQLRANGADVAAPLPWRYSFSASAAARLEPLSVALVSRGYAIESLRPGAAGGTDLLVTRVELLTPTALERRNRELRRWRANTACDTTASTSRPATPGERARIGSSGANAPRGAHARRARDAREPVGPVDRRRGYGRRRPDSEPRAHWGRRDRLVDLHVRVLGVRLLAHGDDGPHGASDRRRRRDRGRRKSRPGALDRGRHRSRDRRAAVADSRDRIRAARRERRGRGARARLFRHPRLGGAGLTRNLCAVRLVDRPRPHGPRARHGRRVERHQRRARRGAGAAARLGRAGRRHGCHERRDRGGGGRRRARVAAAPCARCGSPARALARWRQAQTHVRDQLRHHDPHARVHRDLRVVHGDGRDLRGCDARRQCVADDLCLRDRRVSRRHRVRDRGSGRPRDRRRASRGTARRGAPLDLLGRRSRARQLSGLLCARRPDHRRADDRSGGAPGRPRVPGVGGRDSGGRRMGVPARRRLHRRDAHGRHASRRVGGIGSLPRRVVAAASPSATMGSGPPS